MRAIAEGLRFPRHFDDEICHDEFNVEFDHVDERVERDIAVHLASV